jgi:hypothetical protein
MATQRRIGTPTRIGDSLALPLAILAFAIAATIALVVIVNVSARSPIPDGAIPLPAATTLAAPVDDRPPHHRSLPFVPGTDVAPVPTPGRVPEWEDLHPAP